MLKTVSQSLHDVLNYAKEIPQARKQGEITMTPSHTPLRRFGHILPTPDSLIVSRSPEPATKQPSLPPDRAA